MVWQRAFAPLGRTPEDMAVSGARVSGVLTGEM